MKSRSPCEQLSCRNIDFSESMKRGAESGDVQSMHLYANHCLRQYSIKGDIDSRKEAEYYLCKAAEAGLFHAQLDLATAYWFRFDEIRNKTPMILSLSDCKTHCGKIVDVMIDFRKDIKLLRNSVAKMKISCSKIIVEWNKA